MRYFLLVLLVILFLNNIANSQQEERSQRETRTTEEEHEPNASDSTTFVLDTLNLWRPIKTHNSISLSNLIYKQNISKKDLLLLPYFTLSDIFKERNLGFPRSAGFPGLNNSVVMLAGLPNGIDLRYNNISQAIPLTNESLWSIFPMENIENIEIITGSQAFILGNNSNGTLINLQEIQHHTYKPYTKLWYNQSIDETIATDGMFSQNFAKNFNLLLGFRSIFSPGTYDNQWVENWNLRAKVRWNIDSLTNITLSENFTNYGISENGGINRMFSPDVFDPLNAFPTLRYADTRLFQHNINLSLSTFLDELKTNSFSSSISLIFNDYSFQDREGIINNPLDSNYQYVFYNTIISNNTSYEIDTEYLDLKAGGDIIYNYTGNNNTILVDNYLDFGVYGFASLNLSEYLKISGGGRLFKKYQNEGYAFGGKIESKINNNFTYYFDASLGTRLPSIFESKQAVKEIHNLYIFGTNWQISNTKIAAMVYYRYVDNPIRFKFSYDTTKNRFNTEFYNSSNKNYPGIEFSAQTNLWVFGLDTKFNLNFENINSSSIQDFPLFWANIRLYYTILSGESYIKIGLSGDLISSFRGLGYYPLYAGYYEYDKQSSFMGNGIDAFAQAKLGTAHIKVRFNNILNQGYYYTPINPEPGRHFQFSFSWAFLD